MRVRFLDTNGALIFEREMSETGETLQFKAHTYRRVHDTPLPDVVTYRRESSIPQEMVVVSGTINVPTAAPVVKKDESKVPPPPTSEK